jgi:PAS domain-containing protein
MPQREIELILMRQLAGYLRMPILVVDPNGDLLFFNEAAEEILGRRFEETGVIRRGEWTSLLKPTHADGSPVKREQMPLFVATEHRRPSYLRSWVVGLDGVRREVEGIAFPLLGQGDRFLGAAGIFWEVNPE